MKTTLLATTVCALAILLLFSMVPSQIFGAENYDGNIPQDAGNNQYDGITPDTGVLDQQEYTYKIPTSSEVSRGPVNGAYGDIGAELDSVDLPGRCYGAFVKVGTDILLTSYQVGGYPAIATYRVGTDGSISAQIDYMIIDSSENSGGNFCDIAHVSGDVYVIIYDQYAQGGIYPNYRKYLRLKTFNVDDTGILTSNTGYCQLDSYTDTSGAYPGDKLIRRGDYGGNVIIAAFWSDLYSGHGLGPATVTTLSIPPNGSTITPIESIEVSTITGRRYHSHDIQWVYGDIYLCSFIEDYYGYRINARCVNIPATGMGMTCPYSTVYWGGNNGMQVSRLEPDGNIFAWNQSIYCWTRNVADDGFIGPIIATKVLEQSLGDVGGVNLPKNPLTNHVIIFMCYTNYDSRYHRKYATLDVSADGAIGSILDSNEIDIVPSAVYGAEALVFYSGVPGDLNLLVVRTREDAGLHIATLMVESPSNVNVPPITSPVYITNESSSTPTINWTYSDADGDAQVQFQVEVWTQPNGNGTIMWEPSPENGASTSVVYAGLSLLEDRHTMPGLELLMALHGVIGPRQVWYRHRVSGLPLAA